MNVDDPAWSFLFNDKGIDTLFYIMRVKYVKNVSGGSLATDFRRVKMAPGLSTSFTCSIPAFYICIPVTATGCFIFQETF